jgi:hypothetical protein
MDIGTETDDAGIGISAFIQQLSPVSWPSSTGLGYPYFGTGLDAASALFHSGTGLTGCRTVRHSGILKNCTKVL